MSIFTTNNFCLSRDKIPLHPKRLSNASVTDPEILLSWNKALELSALHSAEISFVIKPPFFCIDIDKCFFENGKHKKIVEKLLKKFEGKTYQEISRSGTGCHIIGITKHLEHKSKETKNQIELYTKDRHIVLNRLNSIGDITCDCTLDLLDVVIEHFNPETELSELLSKKTPKNLLGLGASLAELFFADEQSLSKHYPHSTRPYDSSSADLALCNHLAFHLRGDRAKVQKYFEESHLVRDKWKNREDYRENTINEACKKYNTSSTPGIREGLQLMSVAEQIEYFKDCVLVVNQNRIYTPEGLALNHSQFRAYFGGYIFALDDLAEKTTRDAWEAFTESRAYKFPRCVDTTFQPGKKAEDRYYNTYRAIVTPQKEGDIKPWIIHCEKLLPDSRDRDILWSYLAALILNPGFKFQWAPVLQGTEGNGKSFITKVMLHCVGREYCTLPNAQDISNKFNKWIDGKLFAAVEEVSIKGDFEKLETLKVLITNSELDLQGKGENQKLQYNFVNFVLYTNWLDGIPVTIDSRRYAIFYTAQQSFADIQRDKMDGSYFKNLYSWASDKGYSVINKWLREYEINPEFDPAGSCQRAPKTSSTEKAINLTVPKKFDELKEIIAQEPQGLRNGWINFSVLIKHFPNKYSTISKYLNELGYFQHPGLTDGRFRQGTIFDDFKRSKIYVNPIHYSLGLQSPQEIREAYINDQQST